MRYIIAALLTLISSCAFAQAPTRICIQNGTSCIDVPANMVEKPYSVKIATGGTYQLIIPAGNKFSIQIQNNNTTTDNCFVEDSSLVVAGNTTSTSVTSNNGVTTAQGASILLAPGGSYQRYFPLIPANPIVATCASTNDTLYISIQ